MRPSHFALFTQRGFGHKARFVAPNTRTFNKFVFLLSEVYNHLRLSREGRPRPVGANNAPVEYLARCRLKKYHTSIRTQRISYEITHSEEYTHSRSNRHTQRDRPPTSSQAQTGTISPRLSRFLDATELAQKSLRSAVLRFLTSAASIRDAAPVPTNPRRRHSSSPSSAGAAIGAIIGTLTMRGPTQYGVRVAWHNEVHDEGEEFVPSA